MVCTNATPNNTNRSTAMNPLVCIRSSAHLLLVTGHNSQTSDSQTEALTSSSMSVLSSRYPSPPFWSLEATSRMSLRRYLRSSWWPWQVLRPGFTFRPRWMEWRMSWYLWTDKTPLSTSLQLNKPGINITRYDEVFTYTAPSVYTFTCSVSWPSARSL